ncbi:hypothetical protein FB451DRAFT_1558636 [Mycena latifolia]|nr:hypothetical protein FB451DRAFT_1558636 [Mycena latifolia]
MADASPYLLSLGIFPRSDSLGLCTSHVTDSPSYELRRGELASLPELDCANHIYTATRFSLRVDTAAVEKLCLLHSPYSILLHPFAYAAARVSEAGTKREKDRAEAERVSLPVSCSPFHFLRGHAPLCQSFGGGPTAPPRSYPITLRRSYPTAPVRSYPTALRRSYPIALRRSYRIVLPLCRSVPTAPLRPYPTAPLRSYPSLTGCVFGRLFNDTPSHDNGWPSVLKKLAHEAGSRSSTHPAVPTARAPVSPPCLASFFMPARPPLVRGVDSLLGLSLPRRVPPPQFGQVLPAAQHAMPASQLIWTKTMSYTSYLPFVPTFLQYMPLLFS